MISISLCMIVKNEEKVLERCLDSLKGIYDEAIIVDTGSTDRTKEIAGKYTDKIYDFAWIDDFSAARNFAMSKATCDYIYMADADEVLDEENRERFFLLKKAMLKEIEIVQMKYCNQLSHSTVYNFDGEYRAKLYKRVREFTFIDPVHEVVRTDPVVYDSDIEILHMPENLHASRDIKIFEKVIKNEGRLSARLIPMYAKELLISGSSEELSNALDYFENLYNNPESVTEDNLKVVYIMLAKIYGEQMDSKGLMTFALKEMVGEGSSEICSVLGEFYEKSGDYEEASMWYYNAVYETKPYIVVKYSTTVPLNGLIRISRQLGKAEDAAFFEKELEKVSL